MKNRSRKKRAHQKTNVINVFLRFLLSATFSKFVFNLLFRIEMQSTRTQRQFHLMTTRFMVFSALNERYSAELKLVWLRKFVDKLIEASRVRVRFVNWVNAGKKNQVLRKYKLRTRVLFKVVLIENSIKIKTGRTSLSLSLYLFCTVYFYLFCTFLLIFEILFIENIYLWVL